MNNKITNFLCRHVKLCIFFGSDLAFLVVIATISSVTDRSLVIAVVLIMLSFCFGKSLSRGGGGALTFEKGRGVRPQNLKPYP